MSAARLLRRRQWASDAPVVRNDLVIRNERGEYLYTLPPHRATTYHEWAVRHGLRHPTFQKRARLRRRDLGLPETSTDMHRAHGRSIR